MKKVLSYMSMFGLTLVMLGCGGGTPVVNIDNSQLLEKPAKTNNIEAAIKKGAVKRGWRVKKIKNGLFEVSQLIRNKYMVIVDVTYTTKGYKVDYKSSTNLKYNPETNTIHRSYNKWINNLVRDIDAELVYNGSL